MTDWETLLDQLDDYVEDSDMSNLQIPDPVDLATAKIRYNIFKLKCVVKVLNQYAEPTNTVPAGQLARRVMMSKDDFRKHLTKHSFFKSCAENKWTYSRAVMKLKQDELQIIRERTMEELEKLSAGRAIRKRTLNDYWQEADPTIVKTGYATLPSIIVLGKILSRGFQWIGDFKASSTWAREIRDACNLNGKRNGGNENSDNFGKICDWVDDQIENEGLLTLDDFREKYIEITGAASKDWTKLNKRIRTRLNLRSVCTVEQYVGWRNKTRKRHKWRWERKS